MSLFSKENIENSVLIKRENRLNWFIMSQHYFDIVKLAMDNKETLDFISILAVLRQGVENLLKGIINRLNDMCNPPKELEKCFRKNSRSQPSCSIEDTHDLKQLLCCLCAQLDIIEFKSIDYNSTFKLDTTWRDTYIEDILNWINELHEVDPKGFEFRFPKTKTKPLIGKHHDCDFFVNVDELNKFMIIFDGFIMLLDVLYVIEKGHQSYYNNRVAFNTTWLYINYYKQDMMLDVATKINIPKTLIFNFSKKYPPEEFEGKEYF